MLSSPIVNQNPDTCSYLPDKISRMESFFAKDLKNLDQNCSKTKDLRNVFDGRTETLYQDKIHVGLNGKRLVSDEIFGSILPVIENHLEIMVKN